MEAKGKPSLAKRAKAKPPSTTNIGAPHSKAATNIRTHGHKSMTSPSNQAAKQIPVSGQTNAKAVFTHWLSCPRAASLAPNMANPKGMVACNHHTGMSYANSLGEAISLNTNCQLAHARTPQITPAAICANCSPLSKRRPKLVRCP